jgi:antitoxin component YwqK of YwqJK toxin-antitoxin module
MGVPHGIQKQWYQSGAKFKHLSLNHGIEEGLQQSWRENGKIYNNYEAKNGRIFGLKRANLCYELEEEIIQTNN